MNIKEKIGLIIMVVSSIGMCIALTFNDFIFLVFNGFYFIWSALALIDVSLERLKEGYNGNKKR